MSRLSFSSISSTDSRLGGGALERAEAEEALEDAEELEDVVLDEDEVYDALAVPSFLRALPEEEDDVVRVSVPNGSLDVLVVSGALSLRKSTSSSPSLAKIGTHV